MNLKEFIEAVINKKIAEQMDKLNSEINKSISRIEKLKVLIAKEQQIKTHKAKRNFYRQLKKDGLIDYIKSAESFGIEGLIQNEKKRIKALKKEIEKIPKKIYRRHILSVGDITFATRGKEVTCTRKDESQLAPIRHEDFIELHSFGSSGSAGFRHRYTSITFEILDKDIVNNKTAVLFEVSVVSYYYNQLRGIYKRRFVAGYDDDHLFLMRTYSTANAVKEAVLRIIPKEVQNAINNGKEVIRWGDIWLIKMAHIHAPSDLSTIQIRTNHIIKGFRRGKQIYAVELLSHPEHKIPTLNGIYKVLTNKNISTNICGD